MSGARIDRGLTDAQPFLSDAEYVKKGVEFGSLTGVAITRLGNGDWFYAVDTTSAARTVTLPVVGDEVGRHHIVKRVTGGANACKIVSDGGLLDGSATHSIAAQHDVRCYFSDGEVWRTTFPASLYAPVGHNHAASSISFSANGNIVATNVQAAIDELDDEKQAQNADLQKLASATAWTAFAPTVASSSGTLGGATAAGRYQQVGKNVFFQIDITITNVGTGSGNVNVFGFPVASRNDIGCSGVEIAIAGYTVTGQMAASGTAMFIRRYDGANIVTLNARFVITGVYEAP